MKIGIITMPLCANYGGTLQNWALQQVLKRMGHEPITLRFPVEYQGMPKLAFWLRVYPEKMARYFAHKLIGRPYEKPETLGSWRKRVAGMQDFVTKHINVTEYLPKLNANDLKRYDVDALVVGSDQIWRPVMYDAVKYYFCGFAKDSDIPKIAYAPSVALDEWPYNEKITIQQRELIKKFSAISVREESSVKLVKENLGADAKWVLDPTMLLDKEDYEELCKDIAEDRTPFVFAYILDMSEEKRQMAEQTAKALGCCVKYLTAGKVKAEDTIEKWLANFRDAKYVITDSYHGTVFSLIFQKQFYCFYNTYRGKARMDSLKKISGLDDRFIQSSVTLSPDIDYVCSMLSLHEKKEESKKWLLGALKNRKTR